MVPLAVGSTISDSAERPRPAQVLGSLATSSRSTCLPDAERLMVAAVLYEREVFDRQPKP